ncbi:hypothetical protein C1H46_019779 [Malus baccata]|uniref:non-specific serine/threonine protein kinase n=1 Tax=Malus baccata TaxID=106549 RepID=A0A540M706_MALBA|nr:hypothetical protein C1H46_019779 [Malus baccata]
MGLCCSKNVAVSEADNKPAAAQQSKHSPVAPVPPSSRPGDAHSGKHTPANSFSASPCPSPLPAGIAPSPARTPGRKFRWPLPPPSPAKPIMEALRRRQGREVKPKDGPIPEEHPGGGEGEGGERALDKSFGYGKNIGAKFELGKEVGRGHFGHTCWAKGKKGELKGQPVAVKIIAKAKMTTAIAIEDVRREVKILKALAGHKNLVRFYDAFEDDHNVYIVMELCEGGELLDKILSRGGRYTEKDAKTIVVQILSVVSFCHLQGVVHRDLKPENFLFTTRDEDAPMKALSKALTEDELFYLRAQFRLLDPKNGHVSLDNFRTALMKNSTDAMKMSRVYDIINLMEPLSHKKLDFEEFCVATISSYQLEAHEEWEKIASTAFEHFENEGNRVISVEELAQEMNLGPTSYQLLNDWIRPSDRKLTLLGYTKFLHGVTVRSSNPRRP